MSYRLGVDVGGTFTDLALLDEATGRLTVGKVPSVPADPSLAILGGLRRILADAGVPPGAVGFLAHGTTVATNTLLQRKGARTGLITTRGFRDLLEIARQRRPSLYDLHLPKPAPLIPRERRLEVPERVLADGRVRIPLDLAAVDRALEALAGAGVEALAVTFLYSFLHPAHERAVAARARARLPGVFVTASHEVLPELREYERLATTVANAYLGPVVAGYLQAFRRRVAELGIPVCPAINQSNGGTISLDEAARFPVRTVLSGPAAGVAGAAWLAAQAGTPSVVTLDMGGTSTDVCLVRQGRATFTAEREIAGVPLRVPALDIHTIAAGGGSVAWRDSAGALLVGPESAGADPGPACYARGGQRPTVTDADLVLGRLGPRGLLGGRMPLDVEGAREAIAKLAAELDLPLEETARGVVRVADAGMSRALRLVTVQRGVDPTGLALLAFGGAGPLHAGALARELGIPTILVPPAPGILCALGLLVEDRRLDLVRTRVGRLDGRLLAELEEGFRDLETEATAWLDREGVPPGRRVLQRQLDLRYEGQNYELTVEVDAGTDAPALERLRRRFFALHEEAYGFAATDEPVQVVNLRLVARGLTHPPVLPRAEPGPPDPGEALVECRPVDLADAGGLRQCPVYDRARLRPGHRVRGPAVIEQFDSTTLVLPGQTASVDALGILVIAEDGP